MIDREKVADFERQFSTLVDTLELLRKARPPAALGGTRDVVRWAQDIKRALDTLPPVGDINKLSRFAEDVDRTIRGVESVARMAEDKAERAAREEDEPKILPKQMFWARLTSEVGGGVYAASLLQENGVTPVDPPVALTNVKEVNGIEGIDVGAEDGAIVRVWPFGDEWRFEYAAAGPSYGDPTGHRSWKFHIDAVEEEYEGFDVTLTLDEKDLHEIPFRIYTMGKDFLYDPLSVWTGADTYVFYIPSDNHGEITFYHHTPDADGVDFRLYLDDGILKLHASGYFEGHGGLDAIVMLELYSPLPESETITLPPPEP